MAVPQTVWGIDIGRSALKAVKLRSTSDGKVELVAHDYIEHAKILSQPDANRDELISDALEKFLSRNDLSRDGVFVAVPGQHTLARFTKLPPVSPKKIPDIVRYEADQQIPFDMDEVIWDYQVFESEDLPDVEVGIFAMKRELIREHLLHFEQASIEPAGVQAGPLAVYNAIHFDGLLADDTTILLDIGAENTDLIIATPHGLWTRTIAIGGNSFTDALVKSFKLSFSKAENLKQTASASKYARQVFQAMRPVFADLVQELQRSIGFYSSTHRDAEIDKIVGLGNAFKLPGLQKYLEQNLNLPVERIDSYQKLETPSDSDFGRELLSFAVPYGLALQGLDLAQVTSNLLPAEIARQMVWSRKKPTFAAAAACLLLAGGLIWSRQYSDMNAIRAGSENVPGSINLERAYEVVEGGPSGSLAPRAAATEVLLAGRKISQELSTLQGQGQGELEERDKLIAIQENKAVVPKILQFIHEAVPKPEGPLADARTQEEVMEAIAGVARNKREQVFIESINIQFEPDVNVLGDWGYNLVDKDAENVAYHDADGVVRPGFVARISCVSPNEGGSTFIQDGFMENLREMGRRPGMGYCVNRVFLVGGARLNLADRGKKAGFGGRSGYGSAFGSGGRGGGRSGVAVFKPVWPDDFDAEIAQRTDPLTGESVEEDWRFELVMDVILEDYPEEEAYEGEFADEEGD